jgi:hypothetical protein
MKFSFVPLLLDGKTLSVEARNALRENRLRDAATLLMHQYDLNCREAGDLLDLSLCGEDPGARDMTNVRRVLG